MVKGFGASQEVTSSSAGASRMRSARGMRRDAFRVRTPRRFSPLRQPPSYHPSLLHATPTRGKEGVCGSGGGVASAQKEEKMSWRKEKRESARLIEQGDDARKKGKKKNDGHGKTLSLPFRRGCQPMQQGASSR